MKNILFAIAATAFLFTFMASEADAGNCYWVCSEGKWVPIKQGICIMPIKPVGLCY